MIESLISEDEWLTMLGVAPLWEPPATPLLVIAPHPDDETLGAGGLIASHRARGLEVTVVAVTDGENAYLDVDPLGTETLRELRRGEQTRALARLGVDADRIVRLSLPDSGVTPLEDELVHLLEPLVTTDVHVIAPWTGDFHPDHEACGRAAARVAKQKRARLTSYFFWTWHRGTPELLASSESSLRLFRFDGSVENAKWEALLCHHSQLVREGGHAILPDHLLAPARRSFEVFAIA